MRRTAHSCRRAVARRIAISSGVRPNVSSRASSISEIETADQIARSIERAESVLGAERIKYIHPDCGFWMLKRNIADGKIRALVQGRDRHHGLAA